MSLRRYLRWLSLEAAAGSRGRQAQDRGRAEAGARRGFDLSRARHCAAGGQQGARQRGRGWPGSQDHPGAAHSVDHAYTSGHCPIMTWIYQYGSRKPSKGPKDTWHFTSGTSRSSARVLLPEILTPSTEMGRMVSRQGSWPGRWRSWRGSWRPQRGTAST